MFSLSVFWKVFVPVFIVVVYPGPCVLSYGNIAINYGYKKGYSAVFGCWTAEALYWFLGIFALGAAQSMLPDVLVQSLMVFAGLFLLYIAYDFFKTDPSKLEAGDVKNDGWKIYLKFLLLTLSNPVAIIGYAGIYVGIENVKDYIPTILLASAAGSMTAHSVVVLSSSAIGKLISKNKNSGSKMLKIVNIISATCIAGYSVVQILFPIAKNAVIKIFG